MYGQLRRRFGEITRDLCRQKGIELVEGHAMPDHVHLCLSVPPKYSISYVVGYLKGKSAIRLHQDLSNKMRGSKSFWARGYFVSTVGLDENQVRQYIRHQESTENRQMEFDFEDK